MLWVRVHVYGDGVGSCIMEVFVIGGCMRAVLRATRPSAQGGERLRMLYEST